MGPGVDLQIWAGRLCLGMVTVLGFLGYHFANVRFVPMAVGFAILAGVFYTWRAQPAQQSRSLANSGQHRAL